ncbi:MAG: 1-acyl-sn-glycerol-3-phosphate acyltransferase [Sideroxydans sp.]|nr:1-acyl-sn-glycerol-3-phosphate acyltransferase [Sideroxydans sp.]
MHKYSAALFRATRLTCHLVYGTLLSIAYPLLKLPTRQRILKQWSRELLEILHVHLDIEGSLPAPPEPGAMLIANHISWLDVFVLNATLPSCFIAKSEVRGWPLIGMLCQRTRTIFIERDIRRDTLRINRQISTMLEEGEYITLFPEGTSTDGTQLRHFHSSLFQSAIDNEVAIRPIAIRYHDGTGRHCHDAAFIGDMSFIQSLQNVLLSHSLHATLTFLPALSCAGKNRRILAAEAQTAIGTVLAGYAPYQHAATTDDGLTESSSPSGFQSAYSLLLDPIFKFKKRHSS